MKVLQFPLAKITLAFIAGILFAFFSVANASSVFALLTVTALLFCIAYYFSNKQFYPPISFGITAYALFFSVGASTQFLHSGYLQKSHYIHQIKTVGKTHLAEVVLRDKLKTSAYNNRYVAKIIKLDGTPCSGKLLVNFKRDDFAQSFPIGTQLQIAAPIYKHQKSKNPNQFDYGDYLTNKSILAQVYVGAGQLKIGTEVQKDIFYYSDKLRNRLLGNLEKAQFRPTELAVIAALMLGQQQDISADILQDYQLAGAIHILSVSGLHVGFVLMFLTGMLRLLPNTKWMRRCKLVAIILSLWGFAVLAGLSPSVIRSVTMFSFVAVGMHLKRPTEIFHTLLVSMLLILLFEPSFLFDVGFQLSYTALFFILWLQPMLADMWEPENKIVRYFWQILTVSFAAQIGTLPLSVYYFHQFPGLFFITNLVIIPFLSVIMALGLLVMVPSALGYVPKLLSQLLDGSVFFLNRIIHWIASFESFIISDISFNRNLMLVLYLLIIAVVFWLQKPNFRKAVFVLCTIMLLQCSYFATQWSLSAQSEWIVFNVKKSTMIGERSGKRIVIYSNDRIKENRMLKTYAIANFSAITKHQPLRNTSCFNGKKILILDSLGVYPNHCRPDVLLLTKSPKINLERLLETMRPKTIVADASNYKSYVALWRATCKKQKIPFHATAETGFFKL